MGSEADRATFRTLHTASLAAPALREGLSETTAEKAARHLRTLLGTPALALTDTDRLLAWDGAAHHHAPHAADLAAVAIERGETLVFDRKDLVCTQPGCTLRAAIVTPLVSDDRVLGTLQAYASESSAGLARATDEVATWASGQLELGELDASRRRLMEAEVRALRAQISPHFVYNSLTAIASFVRTDPDRARELLLDFADYTRHSFRRLGDYTTIEEELGSIRRYLVLEQARFGDRLGVELRIAPETLPISIPVLSLQPLVENAVRHGLAPKPEGGTVTISARDLDREALLVVEDDGVGEDPERIRRVLAGDTSLDSVGLFNVDERLRSTFGDDYGLVVETAPQAGTKVTVRVPKFASGVRP
ncbi:sensor histidine kinase [Nocardioides sp. Kera G14]|uniref:sensor histidine kinase n=1 Tax=Nocardioides sp. Kera G14 TaxID=2884264 RepID=UPI001D12E417|nr:histidine kinase [Nocardioides sp. Kera G14]UDY23787.1 histidine kinase [Nocardioides sp. Kera G14]